MISADALGASLGQSLGTEAGNAILNKVNSWNQASQNASVSSALSNNGIFSSSNASSANAANAQNQSANNSGTDYGQGNTVPTGKTNSANSTTNASGLPTSTAVWSPSGGNPTVIGGGLNINPTIPALPPVTSTPANNLQGYMPIPSIQDEAASYFGMNSSIVVASSQGFGITFQQNFKTEITSAENWIESGLDNIADASKDSLSSLSIEELQSSYGLYLRSLASFNPLLVTYDLVEATVSVYKATPGNGLEEGIEDYGGVGVGMLSGLVVGGGLEAFGMGSSTPIAIPASIAAYSVAVGLWKAGVNDVFTKYGWQQPSQSSSGSSPAKLNY